MHICSTLHLVFDDGDEKTLRRTSLCLKGERHFQEDEVDNFFISTLFTGSRAQSEILLSNLSSVQIFA